jgi:hypothetical protein
MAVSATRFVVAVGGERAVVLPQVSPDTALEHCLLPPVGSSDSHHSSY